MSHFDSGDWSDFVRGLVKDALAREMEMHRANCAACQRTANLLHHVAATGRADRELEPPKQLMRWANALFSTHAAEPVPVPRKAKTLLARLVFDSQLAPELAGVRARGGIGRHLLYEAGVFRLDLQLEHERGSPHVTLVGQILDREHPERSLSAASIQLVRGQTVVARTRCNRFGEFQIQYEPNGRLRLYVTERRRNRRVVLSLNGLKSDQPHT
jgi:hypothetical protein